MAVESNAGNTTRKRRGGSMFAAGRFYRAKRVFQIILGFFAALIIIACLFGFINQAATGQSIYDWTIETGNKVGDALILIFTGEENAPIHVTDEGIYVDGYQPDGAEDILKNDESNPENAENSE